MKKLSYYNGNEDYGLEYYPFNYYEPTGMIQEFPINMDTRENRQPNGEEFDEFRQFRRKRRIKRLKDKKNEENAEVLQPTPFYEDLYGTPSSYVGLYSSPLEYYEGTIMDDVDSYNNPYQNSYQTASKDIYNEEIEMPLFKSAQIIEDENFADEVILYDELPEKEDVIELHEPEEKKEIVFKLAPLPGANMMEPIEVSEGEEANEEIPKDKEIEVNDPWNWQKGGLESFLQWVQSRFNNLPTHSGESVGVERTISYLKRINNEISKAISSDYDGKISVEHLEKARNEIHSAIDRLEDYLEEKKEKLGKKSKAMSDDGDMVKEAQKSTHVGGIIITVPLHISAIARACINSMISAGKDIERTASYFITKYNLNDRDQMELFQLLNDMGYMFVRPRGLSLDEEFDRSSSDNIDYMAQYKA
jgi:ElaB/YqjD/DUF883 family membrane-anchored ribosome-binding protein